MGMKLLKGVQHFLSVLLGSAGHGHHEEVLRKYTLPQPGTKLQRRDLNRSKTTRVIFHAGDSEQLHSEGGLAS